MHLRLATRASPLALWQARYAARLLRQAYPRLTISLVPLTAVADVDLVTPLYRMGTVGVFCKEVHQAILSGRADLGVHSCKDLPTQSPHGIRLAATLARDDVRDGLIGARSLQALPQAAQIGSSSLRRRHQLADLRPDLTYCDLRGNVQTRLKAVREGRVGATLLAMAGLRRLDLATVATPLHPLDELIPAPAQGAIAIDCLESAHGVRRLLAGLNHLPTWNAVHIERELLAALEGGCTLPLGALALRSGPSWQLHAALGLAKGPCARLSLNGPAGRIAQQAAAQLRAEI